MTADAIGPVSNDGEDAIIAPRPVLVDVEITGTSPMLFHRWSVESVAAKAAAPKGSAEKKSDDVDSYVYRNEAGMICLPGEYVRQACIEVGRYRQDPRSARKSARDLYKAALVCLTEGASLGTDKWDYLDQRRVMVQRNGITRERPAFHTGWKAEFQFELILPDYLNPLQFHSVLSDAGRFVGVGDFRPSYGRFAVTRFEEVVLN